MQKIGAVVLYLFHKEKEERGVVLHDPLCEITLKIHHGIQKSLRVLLALILNFLAAPFISVQMKGKEKGVS